MITYGSNQITSYLFWTKCWRGPIVRVKCCPNQVAPTKSWVKWLKGHELPRGRRGLDRSIDFRGKDCRGKSKWRREDWRAKTVEAWERILNLLLSRKYICGRVERERGGSAVGGWWISTMIQWLKQLRKSFGFSFLWLICLIYFTQVGFSILPLSSFASFLFTCMYEYGFVDGSHVPGNWSLLVAGCWGFLVFESYIWGFVNLGLWFWEGL